MWNVAIVALTIHNHKLNPTLYDNHLRDNACIKKPCAARLYDIRKRTNLPQPRQRRSPLPDTHSKPTNHMNNVTRTTKHTSSSLVWSPHSRNHAEAHAHGARRVNVSFSPSVFACDIVTTSQAQAQQPAAALHTKRAVRSRQHASGFIFTNMPASGG